MRKFDLADIQWIRSDYQPVNSFLGPHSRYATSRDIQSRLTRSLLYCWLMYLSTYWPWINNTEFRGVLHLTNTSFTLAHLYCAMYATQKICQRKWTPMTHFSREADMPVSPLGKCVSANGVRRKKCAVHLHTQIKCAASTKKMCVAKTCQCKQGIKY